MGRGWRTALRWGQLVLGLFGFGLAIALMIRSGLGLGPWDAFHVGLHRLTGISIGTASLLTGLVILVGSRYLGVRPGVGTLINMVLIGIFIDLVLPRIAAAADWAWGLAYYLTALALAGLCTGLYIGAGLGKGPRDGLVVGLAQRTGWPVRRARTLIELSVLALGWSMGGVVGVGTVLFTFGIGPAMQWGMQLFGELPVSSPPPIAERPAVGG